MTTNIFHVPGDQDIAVLAFGLIAMVLINEGLAFVFGFRVPFWTRATILCVVAMVVCTTLRQDISDWLKVAVLAWIWIAPRKPWDKLKKKLSSTISSLTEVAKASIERQQTEAFS